jgi:2-polyprenyl-3-methyl-5-hydroxy-6-metoxy-1,4-benzoquinol methylase
MARYTTDHLVGVGRDEFEGTIHRFLSIDDAAMEGFTDPAAQRDLSIRFQWGHDHDFGTFFLPGLMRDRHLALLATFIDRFGALPRNLDGARVLDVGCWTGGTSLVLAAMGARVTAVEEVLKYVECVRYLARSFDVDGLDVRHASLYDCRGPEYDDAFEVVLCAGVLYHLTDPVLALRICFNALADGGWCLVETANVRSRAPVLAYDGPSKREVSAAAGSGARIATGWNWFRPSSSALTAMMRDVGFEDVVARDAVGGRAFAVGRRRRHSDVLRSGLSDPRVR